MDSKKTRIVVRELPARPRKVDASEMIEVFGGCVAYQQPCSGDSDCCVPWTCSWGMFGTGRKCRAIMF
jgi:hypothetical protein